MTRHTPITYSPAFLELAAKGLRSDQAKTEGVRIDPRDPLRWSILVGSRSAYLRVNWLDTKGRDYISDRTL